MVSTKIMMNRITPTALPTPKRPLLIASLYIWNAGTVVESMDNIFKYAASSSDLESQVKKPSLLSVSKEGDEFVVTAGNMIMSEDVEDLRFKLDRVNQLDDESLKMLYEEIINQETRLNDKGAGLGLITMALRTEKDIQYNFTAVDLDHSFFEMQITING